MYQSTTEWGIMWFITGQHSDSQSCLADVFTLTLLIYTMSTLYCLCLWVVLTLTLTPLPGIDIILSTRQNTNKFFQWFYKFLDLTKLLGQFTPALGIQSEKLFLIFQWSINCCCWFGIVTSCFCRAGINTVLNSFSNPSRILPLDVSRTMKLTSWKQPPKTTLSLRNVMIHLAQKTWLI